MDRNVVVLQKRYRGCHDHLVVEHYLVVEEGGNVKENFVYNSMFSTFYCISMTIVASNMTFDLLFGMQLEQKSPHQTATCSRHDIAKIIVVLAIFYIKNKSFTI
jgi:hypothetical protein